jgi:hypothetical protein
MSLFYVSRSALVVDAISSSLYTDEGPHEDTYEDTYEAAGFCMWNDVTGTAWQRKMHETLSVIK